MPSFFRPPPLLWSRLVISTFRVQLAQIWFFLPLRPLWQPIFISRAVTLPSWPITTLSFPATAQPLFVWGPAQLPIFSSAILPFSEQPLSQLFPSQPFPSWSFPIPISSVSLFQLWLFRLLFFSILPPSLPLSSTTQPVSLFTYVRLQLWPEPIVVLFLFGFGPTTFISVWPFPALLSWLLPLFLFITLVFPTRPSSLPLGAPFMPFPSTAVSSATLPSFLQLSTSKFWPLLQLFFFLPTTPPLFASSLQLTSFSIIPSIFWPRPPASPYLFYSFLRVPFASWRLTQLQLGAWLPLLSSLSPKQPLLSSWPPPVEQKRLSHQELLNCLVEQRSKCWV